MKTYIVSTIKPWNVDAFNRRTPDLSGRWILVDAAEEMTGQLISDVRPRYVFFPHWSWRVPEEVLEEAECICFHMTDVPYGRGGSPLQNLVVRGHRETKLTALRMSPDLDAGPVYLKRQLSLKGRAQDIYERAADLIYDMIAEIVESEPEPVPQKGGVTKFRRRTPDQSLLPSTESLDALYDHIRMLDAETYPKAFLDHREFRLEFSHAEMSGDELKARVVIRRRNGG